MKPEGFEFRPANSNEMVEFQKLGNYVFAQAPGDDPPPQLLDPAWTHCAFSNDRLAAISGVFPFVVRLNGKTAPIHGVTMVGTEPEFRRRGLARRLISDLLQRGKDDGLVGSMLLASRGAIYQRFGYGLASTMVTYEFDPREALFQATTAATGYLKRLTRDEASPLVSSVFKDYAKKRNMMALRSDLVWERLLVDMDKEKAFCILHFDAEDKPDGYCIYDTKWASPPDQELTIRDFSYTTIQAYRCIWQYLCSHDLVRRVKWENVPEDDPAPGLLLEPRCLNRKTFDGIWFRVIDADRLLAARHYDVDGDIVIAIAGDDICPWNNGAYHLCARDGSGAVTRADPADAHLDCSINALASILSGHASPSWLSHIGTVSTLEESQLGYYDQLFATRHRPTLSFEF